MRRDIIFGFIGVIVASFFVFGNQHKANTTYKKFEISPIFYKPEFIPIDTKTPVQLPVHSDPVDPPQTYEPKYRTTVDLPNYQDSYSLDTYMELPLETDGKTALTDTLYTDIEETAPISDPTFIKYIRFQCTAIRGPESGAAVHVGGFKFFQGRTVASSKPIHIWNPHTGAAEKYTEGPWSDSDQRTVIFRFSEPIIVNRYEIKSSTESVKFDPVHWKIEGSMTGTFWTPLDDRTALETGFPKERGQIARYIMRDL